MLIVIGFLTGILIFKITIKYIFLEKLIDFGSDLCNVLKVKINFQ